MKTIITIQPASPKSDPLKLPYPYFIDAADGSVGRQDFWKGAPLKLVCFAKKGKNESALTFGAFVASPQKAIKLYPVFEHEGGEWFTYKDPIASVKVEQKKASKK